MHGRLGVALVWLGEGEEAEKYLKKALDQCKEHQVMQYQCVLVFNWNPIAHNYGNQIPLRM